MKAKGRVEKIHTDLTFGMAIVPKHGKVFFSDETIFGSFKFQDFKVGDDVELEFFETERGFFVRVMTKI